MVWCSKEQWDATFQHIIYNVFVCTTSSFVLTDSCISRAFRQTLGISKPPVFLPEAPHHSKTGRNKHSVATAEKPSFKALSIHPCCPLGIPHCCQHHLCVLRGPCWRGVLPLFYPSRRSPAVHRPPLSPAPADGCADSYGLLPAHRCLSWWHRDLLQANELHRQILQISTLQETMIRLHSDPRTTRERMHQ